MGGYHVAVRRAEGNYIGVRSMLKLPDVCDCVYDTSFTSNKPEDAEKYDGVHPEFVHGFYKTIYNSTYRTNTWIGLDIGVIYRNGKWKVFYYGPDSGKSQTFAKDHGYDEKDISVKKGETIELASYIDEASKSVRIEINGNREYGIQAQLTDFAFSQMKKGCDITRELLMATNRTENYKTLGAKFEFAKFHKGMLTDVYRKHMPFIGEYEGSKGDEPNEYDESKVKEKGLLETYDGKNFGCEVGSCTFEKHIDFEIDWWNSQGGNNNDDDDIIELSEGESKKFKLSKGQICEFKFNPRKSGTHSIRVVSSMDLYAELTRKIIDDENEVHYVYSGSDDGHNPRIRRYFEKGTIYFLKVKIHEKETDKKGYFYVDIAKFATINLVKNNQRI